MPTESIIWLGNKASYDAVSDLRARQHEFKEEFKADYMEDERQGPDMTTHPMLQVQGNVGIITVAGPLVAGSAGFMRYYGVTGYEDVANAFLAGLRNPAVEGFVMAVTTPGGDVSGCHETAMFIDQVGKIKPIVTFASGTMASAGLWLGSTAKQVICSATTIVGSLGVMRIHKDFTKQMADEGVKVTIIRSGDQKNLVNPYEPLSKEALASAEAQAGAIHDVFTNWVADHRGVSVAVANTNFAQGQEFVGKWAVEAGLVDAVGTFEQAVSKASALGRSKSSKKPAFSNVQKATNTMRSDASSSNNSAVSGDSGTTPAEVADNSAKKQGTPMPKPYTQEQLTAMAAGVNLEETQGTQVPAGSEGATDNATGNTASTEASAVTDPKDAEIASLKALLATSTDEVTAAKAEVETLTAKVASIEGPLASVSEIVRTSLKSMMIPLNADTKALATMDAATLATEHARVSALFKESFKVGASASMSPADGEGKPKPKVPAILDPRINRMAMSVPRH